MRWEELKNNEGKRMKIRGVIFDLDGTIVDVPYDWPKIKLDLGTQGQPILHYLSSLEEPEKTKKWKILKKYEDEATLKATLKEGMKEFLDFLREKKVKIALVTNNSRKNVRFLLRKFDLEFDCIISRESGLWKPSGDPFLAVLRKLKLRKEECCVIGDSHFDLKAAKEAGIERVFLLSKDKEKFSSIGAEAFPSVEALKERMEELLTV